MALKKSSACTKRTVVPGSDGSISEGLSDEALAHADRSDEQDVLVAVQELEGECGVEESSVDV